MASNIKVDIVRPTATNGSLSLKGDSGGSATANGISVNSSGNTSITGTTTIATADINGGNIDGTTIGASSSAAGTFTTFTSTGIDDNATTTRIKIDDNAAQTKEIVCIGKDIFNEVEDYKEPRATERDDAVLVANSGNNVQEKTSLVVTGGKYNPGGTVTNQTGLELLHNGKDPSYGVGWKLNATADANSTSTDDTALRIQKIKLTGSSGSLSFTYEDSLTIGADKKINFPGIVKLNSSGDTIRESDGTTSILSESSGTATLNNVTLGSNVVFPATIDNTTLGNNVTPNDSFAHYTMDDTVGTGVSATANFSSVTSVLESSDFYTSSFASNQLTVTLKKTGYYKITDSFYIYGSNNIPTYIYRNNLSGTATKYGVPPSNRIAFDSNGGNVGNAHVNITLSFIARATSTDQTLIFYPHFIYSSAATTNYYGSNISIEKVK